MFWLKASSMKWLEGGRLGNTGAILKIISVLILSRYTLMTEMPGWGCNVLSYDQPPLTKPNLTFYIEPCDNLSIDLSQSSTNSNSWFCRPN